jgi:hypothetical protein
MNRTSPASEKLVRLHDKRESAAAPAQPQAHPMRHTLRRERRELSLATLMAIGTLSLGAVAGLAYVLEGEDRLAAVTQTAVTAVQGAPEPIRASGVIETKPSAAAAAASAEAKATPVEASVAAPPEAARSLPEEPVKTGSISPAAVRLPMTLPPRDLPPPEVLPAPLPDAKPVEAAPAHAVPLPEARPAISAAEADSYLARAEAALRSGDLTVARLFFHRLVQAGDARGALGLARTYDEAELRTLPVFGLQPDRAEAERWRQRAQEMTKSAAKM